MIDDAITGVIQIIITNTSRYLPSTGILKLYLRRVTHHASHGSDAVPHTTMLTVTLTPLFSAAAAAAAAAAADDDDDCME
jgi:hypothetical protein